MKRNKIFLVLGILYVLTLTTVAFLDADKEMIRPSRGETYGYSLAVTIFIITGIPFAYGYLGGKKD